MRSHSEVLDIACEALREQGLGVSIFREGRFRGLHVTSAGGARTWVVSVRSCQVTGEVSEPYSFVSTAPARKAVRGDVMALVAPDDSVRFIPSKPWRRWIRSVRADIAAGRRPGVARWFVPVGDLYGSVAKAAQ